MERNVIIPLEEYEKMKEQLKILLEFVNSKNSILLKRDFYSEGICGDVYDYKIVTESNIFKELESQVKSLLDSNSELMKENMNLKIEKNKKRWF